MAAYYGTGSGSLTADPRLQGITKSFGGGEAFNFDSGNLAKKSGMAFDPVSLGIGLGSSVISGLFGSQQAKTSASIANAQLQAQNQAMLEARRKKYFEEVAQKSKILLGATTLEDINLARQKEAQKWMQGPSAERAMGIASEQSKRERLARISPESKEAARFENLLNMKRTGFQEAARMEGMFGPTAFSRRFTNI